MATKTKRPVTWYLGKALNVEANDGLPAGQIRVNYITYDRKLCVQFPNGGQEVHTISKLNDFSKRHGGWVDANPPLPFGQVISREQDKTATRVYNPFDCDLCAVSNVVAHLRECGVSDEDIVKGVMERVTQELKK